MEEGKKLCIPSIEQAWVIACFSFGDRRRRDVHNFMPTVKAAIDGLTDAGLWIDDRDGILTGPDLRRVERTNRNNVRIVGLSLSIYEVKSCQQS